MIYNWPFGQPWSEVYLYYVKSRNSARLITRSVQLFSGCFLLFLTGFWELGHAAVSISCHAPDNIVSPQLNLHERCGHLYAPIQFEDEHPHLDYKQFVTGPIDDTAPLPDKHMLPPLMPDAHALLLSILYEFGEIDQQSILTSPLTDDEIFAWVEEDLYVLEFFKDIYPVQSIDKAPDHAVSLPVNVKVACSCPGGDGIAPIKWSGTGNLVLDFPAQKGALESIALSNSAGSRFDGALDFTMPSTTGNLFSSKDAKLQFQIDAGDIHSWNASIKGAIDGPRATGATGHFAASHFDLEAGLIGHYKSVDE